MFYLFVVQNAVDQPWLLLMLPQLLEMLKKKDLLILPLQFEFYCRHVICDTIKVAGKIQHKK